ncbi:hypothetical protein BDZ94DRAFT_1312546 [Collybia nuda]|uniref:Uncharacterized protein n=1 Tax=Collybia nuda TaxID=64659 RepID=A0A9P5XYW2_9AGAR|nr:hypothetical protein BDZ94DRAFT_1312546 [Collybia nuda]
MYYLSLRKSAILLALLVSNIALVAAINCAPVDDDGSPLTGSSAAGTFVTCTYQGAGPCTYFPTDGSFSSGASTCPQGLPQGDVDPDPNATTTSAATDTPTTTQASTTTTPASTIESTATSISTSATFTPAIPSTTATQPPPTTRTTTQTEDAPPVTSASPTSTPQASSLGVFTSSSPSIITATTVVIVSALIGLPNLLGIAYACVSL